MIHFQRFQNTSATNYNYASETILIYHLCVHSSASTFSRLVYLNFLIILLWDIKTVVRLNDRQREACVKNCIYIYIVCCCNWWYISQSLLLKEASDLLHRAKMNAVAGLCKKWILFVSRWYIGLNLFVLYPSRSKWKKNIGSKWLTRTATNTTRTSSCNVCNPPPPP